MPDTPTLSYAGLDPHAVVSTRLYKWAVGLGLFPLIVGVGIFTVWVVTHAVILQILGGFWLGIGVLFVIAGGICGLVQSAREWSAASRPRGRIILRLLLLTLLYASNFIVAAVILHVAKSLGSLDMSDLSQ